MLRAKSTVAIAAILSLPLPSRAAAHAPQEAPAAVQDAATIEEPVDAEIAAWRRELLRTGFEAARRYPRVPHFKNQARVIERLVEAALRMDQPQLALSMIPAIPNWRRGTGYASYAEYCAEHGLVDTAEKYTGIALEIAKSEAMTDGQSWRRDRVRSYVSRAWIRMGQLDRAVETEGRLEPSERGRIQALLATVDEGVDFDDQIGVLEAIVASGNFDRTMNLLLDLRTALVDNYAIPERRERILALVDHAKWRMESAPADPDAQAGPAPQGEAAEQDPEAAPTSRSSWQQLPVSLRIEVLTDLAEVAAEAGDPTIALELVERCEELLALGHPWRSEFGVPLMASVALASKLAGDEARAARHATEALLAYENERDAQSDMFRAETLRPLAEARWRMGDRDEALGLFRRVLEEGNLNDNSRPRGDDLVDTLISMAELEAEPSEELMARIVEIADRVFPR